ncbi:hypothetical protein F0562_001503 [Nyssa sinensis]|uniref:Uncharacterized protein n=1 Tax=Nyssa sinensis TaxID=561372 RepID=A0A5J5C3V4_9ASTE|nr:hypothetical protein F0562_001503 [Nyssa sinensis]
MAIHNYIRRHASHDMKFEKRDLNPDFIPPHDDNGDVMVMVMMMMMMRAKHMIQGIFGMAIRDPDLKFPKPIGECDLNPDFIPPHDDNGDGDGVDDDDDDDDVSTRIGNDAEDDGYMNYFRD